MLLVLLNLGHGPVLPLQALLLPLSYLLQVVGVEALKTKEDIRTYPHPRIASTASTPQDPPTR